MRVLLDTNILTRLVNSVNRQTHALAEGSVDSIRIAGHTPCLVPQNLYEFWVVATRPTEVNGLGMTPQEVRTEVDDALRLFHLLQDERAIFPRWLDLVTTNEVQGRLTHDARLVAAMSRHGLTHLLTFNDRDFARFNEIIAVHPEPVVSSAASL